MKLTLLSGTLPSQSLIDGLKEEIKSLDPKLVIVQVGHDPASDSYVKKKHESCVRVGMRSEHIQLDQDVSERQMYDLITRLNGDPDVSGYIIQLPLPSRLSAIQPLLFKAIDPMKDVDGFTAYNLGKMFLSQEFEHLPPATPAGVIELLKFYEIPVEGKRVVIVGNSNIVGKPLAIMLLNRGATVTVCHDMTHDLPHETLQADILVSAAGVPDLISKDMVKTGAVVIDIGMTRTEEGLRGDVVFEEVSKVASALTPVPGGIGPMTVACLLRNTVTAKKRQLQRMESSHN